MQPFSPWFTPYIDGMNLSYTSAKSLTVGAGSCSNGDSSNVVTLDAPVVLNCLKTGVVNGVQGAALVASTKYDVYAIGDSSKAQLGGVYAVPAGDSIYLPQGYNIMRRIGSFVTDGSVNIVKFFQTGNGFNRTMTYDVAISVLTAGTSTTYATVDLTAAIPELSKDTQVMLLAAFTPAASGDLATLAQGDSVATAGQAVVTGFEAAKVNQVYVTLPASASMEVKYKVAASGSLNLSVSGYVDAL